MFYILTASSDTYITNKIIDNKFRALNSNVGNAGTLDLFKLYDESSYIESGTRITSSVDEISRILVKFDYSNIEPLLDKNLNINSPAFKAQLRLSEVITGAPVPRNFHVVCYPLAKKFDEGSGRDISSFSDLDSTNFLTSSIAGGIAELWEEAGCSKPGVLSELNVDYYTSGAIGSQYIDFGSSQYFSEGLGDIVFDVTKAVSSSLAGDLENNGFRISFSGSSENDEYTRFIKRFATRNSKNKMIVPSLMLMWDSSINDKHLDLRLNVSSSLFLTNIQSGMPRNLIKDDSLTSVTGQDCLVIRLISGSGTQQESVYSVSASQYTGSTTGVGLEGVYYGNVNLSEFNVGFFGDTLKNNDEVELLEVWALPDLSHAYYSGSLKIKKTNRTVSGFTPRRLHITPVNLYPEYKSSMIANIRLFIEDIDFTTREPSYKLPRIRDSIILDECYYRIVDVETGKIIIPFDKQNNSTKLSTDSRGMFISFLTSGLPKNRLYTIELLVNDYGIEKLVKLKDASFKVV